MNKQIAKQLINKTKDDYNRIAPQFDSTRKYNWRDIAKIIETLDVKKGSKILDLGCGGGRLYEILEKHNISYTGVDISDKLISIAKKKYPKVKFIVADITEFNSKEKYDYIFSIAVLHHVPSKILRDKSIQNIKNSLKNNGTAIVSVWYFWNQWKFVKEIVNQCLKNLILNFNILNKFKPKNYKLNKNYSLPFGDFYIQWKNQKGEILAERYHHAWTIGELKKYGFKIVSKDKNLIGIYKK